MEGNISINQKALYDTCFHAHAAINKLLLSIDKTLQQLWLTRAGDWISHRRVLLVPPTTAGFEINVGGGIEDC